LEAPEILLICRERSIRVGPRLARLLLEAAITFGPHFGTGSAYLPLVRRLSQDVLGATFSRELSAPNAMPPCSPPPHLEQKWLSRCAFLNVDVGRQHDSVELARHLCYSLHKCEYLSSFHLLLLLERDRHLAHPLHQFATQAHAFLNGVASILDCPYHNWESDLTRAFDAVATV
jgi:hypothetical protein